MLWADVGTGKTVSTLTALLHLIDRFDVSRILVVGPRLVAERVWAAEVAEWAHLSGLRVRRIVGTPEQRLAALNDSTADIHTITRDNVAWLEEQFIRAPPVGTRGKPQQFRVFPWDTIVLDESQSFKNQSTARFKSMRRLRTLAQRLYLLSGSLMPNGYEDLWGQFYLIDQGARLGSSEDAFHRRFFRKEVNDGLVTYELIDGAAETIDRLISDITLVLKDMQPPAPRNFIPVTLSKPELAAYKRMVKDSVLEIGDKTITAVNSGVLWGKLLQMANGAVYDAEHNWHLIHNRKVDALIELLESMPRPVIVGYGFRHDLARMQEALAKGGDRVGILRTNASLDAWRRGELDIGIMHPASAGHGLNDLYVSGAENLIWFGFTSNREFYDQLNGRLIGGHRRTGRNPIIHHLVAEGTVDEDALEMLDFKGTQQSTAQMRVAQRLKEEFGGKTSKAVRRQVVAVRSEPSAGTHTEAFDIFA